MSVTASGGTPSLTYQWYKNGSSISGATGTSYGATTTGAYYCITSATGSGCGTSQSSTVTVAVVADPAITTQPIGATICSGATHTMSVSASGGTPSLTYQWYKNGSSISGATSTNFGATTTGTYYCIASASGSGCGTSQSSTVTVTVVADPAITTQPVGATICSGATHTMSVAASGGTPSLTYQWYKNGSSISGATSTTYGATTTGTYYCIASATGSGCGTSQSSTVTVTVVADPAITTQPVGGAICSGDSKTLTVVASGGTPSLTYQWYKNGSSISGATSTNYSATTAGTYYCIASASGSGCGTAQSSTVTVTVTPNASIASVTGTSPLCIGATDTYVANSVILGGGSGAWSSSDPSVATVNSSGLVTSLTSGATNITYTITGGCNGTPSKYKTLTVTPNASIASVTGASPLCIGATDSYSANSVVLGGGSGSWTSSDPSVATVNSLGLVTSLTSGTSNIAYTISGGCNGIASKYKTVTVNPDLPVSVSIAASENPTCAGVSGTFTATPTNGGTPTYQWKLNGAIVGGNSNTYLNSGLINADQVACIVTSTATCATGNPATSNTITMTVTTPTIIGVSNGDYIWSGNTSNDWGTASIWLVYDGANYGVPGVVPDNTKNVFLRAYAPCASNAATTTASSAVSCRDLTIETGLTLGNISQLSVSGDWTNAGTFVAGTGTVTFNAVSYTHLRAHET